MLIHYQFMNFTDSVSRTKMRVTHQCAHYKVKILHTYTHGNVF